MTRAHEHSPKGQRKIFCWGKMGSVCRSFRRHNNRGATRTPYPTRRIRAVPVPDVDESAPLALKKQHR